MTVPAVPMSRQRYDHDIYLPIAHAIGATEADAAAYPGLPKWIPSSDARRLAAYQYLAACQDNGRRYWLPQHMWVSPTGSVAAEIGPNNIGVVDLPPAASYREYGTAAYLVQSARGLVLGDEQRYQIPDAQPSDDPADEKTDTPAQAMQDWIEEWFDDERMPAKLIESEDRTISTGDSIFTITWSTNSGRPKVRVLDAGFYFPDHQSIDDPQYMAWGWDDEDYPPIVHVAWGYEDRRTQEPRIRRNTYRMVKLGAERSLPYGGRSAWTCIHTVDDFSLDAFRQGDTIYTVKPGGVSGGKRLIEEDLAIDFIPVVHVPNDYPGGSGFGRSILLRVAQILDDIAAADTDLAINSAVVASPPVVTQNSSRQDLPAGPGAHWDLFGNADAKILDTSKTLDALLKHADRLAQLLARHSRLGQVLLGMVDPSQVPSGYAMRLGFASAASLEREMTMVREEKYPLIAKFALRLAMVHGAFPAQDIPEIEIVLGKGLPSDRAASIEEVTALLAAGAISIQTAVLMLMESGLPIDDAKDEVDRIKAEHPDKAVQLVEATGDVAAARDLLGLDPLPGVSTGAAPTIAPPQLPGVNLPGSPASQAAAPSPGSQDGPQASGQTAADGNQGTTSA